MPLKSFPEISAAEQHRLARVYAAALPALECLRALVINRRVIKAEEPFVGVYDRVMDESARLLLDAGFGAGVDAPVWESDGKLVILESPFAAPHPTGVHANVNYARRCMRDSLSLGEHPIASHLLYTQQGILDDAVPEQRKRGIEAGLAWRRRADKAVFYVDRGWSTGMLAARDVYDSEGFPYEVRHLEAATAQGTTLINMPDEQ